MMTKNRMEAFSDGVLAIIITIMVLELKPPKSADPAALRLVLPAFSSYVLSFIYIAIYWNNHHHLIQAARQVDGLTLWANMHLLFWLSLVPFVTAWAGDTMFAPWPVAAYGFVLLMAGIAYWILEVALVRRHGRDSALGRAIGYDGKGKLSLTLYAVAIALAFVETRAACAIYFGIAGLWFVPDRRIEKSMRDGAAASEKERGPG